MNILLTNDDGYDSEGIKLLKNKLSKYGRVVILAPDSPRSANSCALTIGKPLFVEQVEPDVFKFSGTPVDCVSFALCNLDIEFDLVVSGCNHGHNISYDTMYSGTIGACLEAMIFQKPAIAFSSNNMDIVEESFDKVWEFIKANNLISDKYILNVNFPDNEVKDIRLGKLYYRKDSNYFTKDDETNGFFAYRHLQMDFSDDPESDCYQVTHGIVSIVPLMRSYFSKTLYDELKTK